MENQSLRKRIVVDPEVMAGKPVIAGTRIPVDAILRLIGQGMTVQEILEDYPRLKKEDVNAALEYSAEIISGEDIFPLMRSKKDAAISS